MAFLFFLSLNSLNSLLTHLLSFCSSSSYSFLCPLTMTLSPSLPPAVCLNPSLSLSVYLSPSPMQHHSFSSGNELFCLLSASPSHSSPRLAITAFLSPPLSPLYLAGYIGSSVCCLGLWQPVSYSKWLWHCVHVSVCNTVHTVHVSVSASLDVYLVCARAMSD